MPMRLDWVPVSAAAFVTGVMALAFLAVLPLLGLLVLRPTLRAEALAASAV